MSHMTIPALGYDEAVRIESDLAARTLPSRLGRINANQNDLPKVNLWCIEHRADTFLTPWWQPSRSGNQKLAKRQRSRSIRHNAKAALAQGFEPVTPTNRFRGWLS